MRLDPRSKNAGRLVYRVQKELQDALAESGLRQQQVAERLAVDKSIVNRRFTGRANLTLRSIADLAWAMDHDIVFQLKPKTRVVSANEHSEKVGMLAQADIESPRAASLALQTFKGANTAMPSSAQTKNRVIKNTVVVPQHETA